MKPSEEFKIRRVQQTIFAPPEGDCLRACIASIFDVDLDDLPNFAKLWGAKLGEDGKWKGDGSLRWWDALGEFAAKHGCSALELVWPADNVWGMTASGAHKWAAIATVKSTRGDWDHCVVASLLTGEVIWDPFPGASIDGRNVANEGLSSWILFVSNPRLIAEREKAARIEGMVALGNAIHAVDDSNVDVLAAIDRLIAEERAKEQA